MNEKVKYVGFWARLIATVLDNIWIAILVYGFLWLTIGEEIFSIEYEPSLLSSMVMYIIPIVIVVVFWKLKSATPAKMIFSMKIVDAETLGQVSTPRLILRYFAYFLSIIPLGLGFIWAAFDKRKQGFHDKIAKTVVIKSPNTKQAIQPE